MRNAGQEFAVHPAHPDDIPHLCDLLTELFTLERDFTPDRAKQSGALEMLVADQSGLSRVLVARVRGRVVGMCSAQIVISTAEGGPAGLVEDVVVRRDLRGLGIGSRLLAELAAWCRSKGATRLQLLADRDNKPALDFYRNRGWSPTQLICMRFSL